MQSVRKYYNLINSGRASFEDSPHYDKERFQKILSEIKENYSVLDIGCGNSLLGDFLNKNNYYVGLDINTKYINNLHSRGINGLVGSVEHLPFKKSTFDFVICTEVLEHVFNPKQVIENIHEILKKNGTAIISVPNIAYWDTRKDLLLGIFAENKSKFYPPEHIRFFTRDDISRLIDDAGLRIIRIHTTKNRIPIEEIVPQFIQTWLLRNFPTLLAWHFIVVCEKD